MLKQRVCTTILGLLSTFTATHAIADCLSMPPDSKSPAVIACESPTSYTFTIAGTVHTYDRDAYRTALLKALGQWFESVGLPAPSAGTIEFWLAVPEDSPAATQARAELHWDGGTLVAYLGIEPDSWHLTDHNIAVLSQGTAYPKSFGHQAEALLVKPQSSANSESVAAFLADFGATDPQPIGAGWQLYHVPAFSEDDVVAAVKSTPGTKTLISAIETNSIMEWIGNRERVFAFSFPNP